MNDEYLVRFVQANETFRCPELEALATLEKVKILILDYREDSPFCVVKFDDIPWSTSEPLSLQNRVLAHARNGNLTQTHSKAASFISRSILSKAILNIWGQGKDYDSLHADIKSRTSHLWPEYAQKSFKFSFDAYCGKRSVAEQRQIINSFSYMAFKGKIAMKNPEAEFVIMEEWEYDPGPPSARNQQNSANATVAPPRVPKRIFFGEWVGGTRRALIEKHDLKKRPYISTTSMDAELALVTANLALACPGKFFLDPFVGTGGFMVAAGELGAISWGSDIDGRSFRGKGEGMDKGVMLNFEKYGLQSMFGDCITSDLTNTPLRVHSGKSVACGSGKGKFGINSNGGGRWLDGIISDPPYGVREGLKVLGSRKSRIEKAKVGQKMPTDNEATPEIDSPLSNGSDMNGVDHDLEGNAVITKLQDQKNTQQEDDGQTQDRSQHQKTLKTDLAAEVIPMHKQAGYIPPKRPYSFEEMQHDILQFASDTLVTGGRLAFWMPSANSPEPVPVPVPDSGPAQESSTPLQPAASHPTTTNPNTDLEITPSSPIPQPAVAVVAAAAKSDSELDPISEPKNPQHKNQDRVESKIKTKPPIGKTSNEIATPMPITAPDPIPDLTSDLIPKHPNLKILHVCTQQFNKWSRNLLVYERIEPPSSSSSPPTIPDQTSALNHGSNQTRHLNDANSRTADDLNPFRRMYFRGFQ